MAGQRGWFSVQCERGGKPHAPHGSDFDIGCVGAGAVSTGSWPLPFWCSCVSCGVCLSPGVVQVELPPGTADAVYLDKLQQALDDAAAVMPQPHLIVYNAGTDILAGDPLGR